MRLSRNVHEGLREKKTRDTEAVSLFMAVLRVWYGCGKASTPPPSFTWQKHAATGIHGRECLMETIDRVFSDFDSLLLSNSHYKKNVGVGSKMDKPDSWVKLSKNSLWVNNPVVGFILLDPMFD